MSTPTVECPSYAPFFGAIGIASAIGLTSKIAFILGIGAAYGTAKSALGIAAMGIVRPELIMRSILPVIMAGIVALYGMIVGMVLNQGLVPSYPAFRGFMQLGAGLCVGISGLGAGYAIGVVGDAGVRGNAQQPRLFVGTILILIFAEVLGLYGMILALFVNAKAMVTFKCREVTT